MPGSRDKVRGGRPPLSHPELSPQSPWRDATRCSAELRYRSKGPELMKKAKLPMDEDARLASLGKLEILDTPAEERFDRITRLTKKLFRVPIALVSLVDSDRQWFKSAQGLEASETPRDVAFCAHAILQDDGLIVEDARADERFADNPLVTGAPSVRFYAGQPICAPDGQRVGTLCVIDTQPRRVNRADRQSLRDLAGLVENELRVNRLSESQLKLRQTLRTARRKASIDPLTRAWNREASFDLLRRELERSQRGERPFAAVMLDLDYFKQLNDTKGHPAGDVVLREVADRMRSQVRPYDVVGRYGGEEFVLALLACPLDKAKDICERIRARIAGEPMETDAGPVSVTASMGLAVYDSERRADLDALLGAADQALLRAKQLGRNRVELAE